MGGRGVDVEGENVIGLLRTDEDSKAEVMDVLEDEKEEEEGWESKTEEPREGGDEEKEEEEEEEDVGSCKSQT